jgi:hypothetical protein
MKLVKLDEVFVKFKEISNPGVLTIRTSVGARGSGGVTEKNRRRRPQKKNPIFYWQTWATVHHVCSPSTILRSSIPVRDVGAKYIPRFFAPSAPRS